MINKVIIPDDDFLFPFLLGSLIKEMINPISTEKVRQKNNDHSWPIARLPPTETATSTDKINNTITTIITEKFAVMPLSRW